MVKNQSTKSDLRGYVSPAVVFVTSCRMKSLICASGTLTNEGITEDEDLGEITWTY